MCSHSHSHGVVLPPSHHSHPHQSLCSHSHSHGVVLPPSLSTHCSERVSVPTHTPMVSYYHQVITHTHTNPCAPTHTPIYHVLTHSAPLTSFHLILTTNASPMHHQPSPTLSHPSCLHRIIITSYHQSLPTTTNRFLSLHTTLLTPPFHSQPSQSSPKSSPISIHTHNDNSRTP